MSDARKPAAPMTITLPAGMFPAAPPPCTPRQMDLAAAQLRATGLTTLTSRRKLSDEDRAFLMHELGHKTNMVVTVAPVPGSPRSAVLAARPFGR